MVFKKKGDRVDVHIWLDVQHCATLDAIAKKYQISRAQVVAGLLEEYEERAMRADYEAVGSSV